MDLSIIVPCRDEAENLRTLFAEIEQASKSLSCSWQVIFVDDGSADATFDIIEELVEAHDSVIGIRLERNYGKTAALSAAFESASGEFVLLMDGDCQNDPADIPKFVDAMRRYDSVCAIRRQRRDSHFRIVQSRIAYRIRNWVTKDGVVDSGCGYQAHRLSLLRQIPLFEGMHRFLPCLMLQEGASMTQIEVNHRPRRHGESKYPFWSRLRRITVDLLAVRWMLSHRIRYSVGERARRQAGASDRH